MGQKSGIAGSGRSFLEILEQATIVGIGGRRARYELRLSDAHKRDDVAASLTSKASGEPFMLEPVIASDPEVLLLVFNSRRFAADTAALFELGYALAHLPGVEQAQPDFPTDLYPEPPLPGRPIEEGVETFPAGCWAGEDPRLDDPHWALDNVRACEAWRLSAEAQRPSEGTGIVIAQPDTGVVLHRELQRDRRVASFDFLDGDVDPEDPLDYDGNVGHGTATGSVAVSGRDGGMSGSAPSALHMPIRCIESVVRVSQVVVAQAINFAVDHGAHVVTMSLGGLPSISLGHAVERAVSANVIVLAAAGNCVGSVVWPARYDDCIAVAGTNKQDVAWRGSCRGYAVDWSAPAENVFRARPDGNDPRAESSAVGQGEGTSFAVALSAGVAALWLAHHGRDRLIDEAARRGETLQAMFRRLAMATARRPPDWDASQFGAGIIDAVALLGADLDTGRGRETTPLPDAARSRAVETLVVERLGTGARDPTLDYELYGPELAHILLSEGRVAGPAPNTRSVPEARAVAPAASQALLGRVRNPKLRAHLEAKV